MKQLLLFIPLLFFIQFISCQNADEITLKRNHKIILDNEDCYISVSYPSIINNSNDPNIHKINEYIYQQSGGSRSSFECIPRKHRYVERGDYQILSLNDSILSIEFYTDIEGITLIEGYNRIYVPMVLNINAKYEGDGFQFQFDLNLISPQRVMPNFNFKNLYSEISAYKKSENAEIPLSPFEEFKRMPFLWGMTEDDFIFYTKGDMSSAFEKITIPLRKVRK